MHTTSADGTRIHLSRLGDGPVVVVTGGAFSTAADARPLADALVARGFCAVTWDRRARGDSGDARGSTPEREVEDLAAVIAAVRTDDGDEVVLLGHSSGALLVLLAAASGVAASALFLSEPPTLFGEGGAPDDLPDRLQALVDAGHGEEAAALFQLEAVGLPREMVEGMRAAGQTALLAPLAQSTVYDARLSLQTSDPGPELLAVSAPVFVLRGEQTFPVLIAAADRLAAAVDGARLVVVPESVMHRPDPAATARVVAEGVGLNSPR